MSRIIKFRGKTFGGKWVEGYYVVEKSTGKHKITDGLLDIDEVKAETIGMGTGVLDKEGTEIFEGDIVRWDKDQRLYVVVFRNGMFYASVEPCNPHIYGGFPLWCLCEKEQNCSIIGNIYDNKELLKQKEL